MAKLHMIPKEYGRVLFLVSVFFNAIYGGRMYQELNNGEFINIIYCGITSIFSFRCHGFIGCQVMLMEF